MEERLAYALQQLANAVPLAALYAALAAAYALPFGITRRADFSFGALHAFAGQVLVLAAAFGWSALYLTAPATAAFAAFLAMAYGLGAARIIGVRLVAPLARHHANTLLAASLAVMILLMEMARIGSDARGLWLPPFFNAPVALAVIGGEAVTLTQIQIVNSSLLALLAFGAHWLVAHTAFGRAWAAVRDDPEAAALCGVDAGRTLRLAHLAGCAIAVLAGILNTAWLGTMDFGASLAYGLKMVFVGAIGGVLSPGAAALGGIALAFAETAWTAFAPLIWRDIFIYGLLVIVLVAWRRIPPGV